jgi:hypothetical protein
MAIFDRAIGRYHYWNESTGHRMTVDDLLREGNLWDKFLNYFFALLFICCLIIGLSLNPLIISYHSKQKRSFANTLFILISSIDQIKSLYFPIVFIPKLLSQQNDKDYYYVQDPSSIHWTSYSNQLILVIASVETVMLVVLCVARYLTLRDPLSSTKEPYFSHLSW